MALLGFFVVTLDALVVNVALSAIGRDLGGGISGLQWVVDGYEDALWLTVSGLGDRDTTCAIVGGIVASRVVVEAIPSEWRAAREPLPSWPL